MMLGQLLHLQGMFELNRQDIHIAYFQTFWDILIWMHQFEGLSTEAIRIHMPPQPTMRVDQVVSAFYHDWVGSAGLFKIGL